MSCDDDFSKHPSEKNESQQKENDGPDNGDS